jgi:hypothetical protein
LNTSIGAVEDTTGGFVSTLGVLVTLPASAAAEAGAEDASPLNRFNNSVTTAWFSSDITSVSIILILGKCACLDVDECLELASEFEAVMDGGGASLTAGVVRTCPVLAASIVGPFGDLLRDLPPPRPRPRPPPCIRCRFHPLNRAPAGTFWETKAPRPKTRAENTITTPDIRTGAGVLNLPPCALGRRDFMER